MMDKTDQREMLKGSLTRYFRLFIDGVNDTGDKLLPGVKVFIDSMIPVINFLAVKTPATINLLQQRRLDLSPVSTTPAMTQLQRLRLVGTLNFPSRTRISIKKLRYFNPKTV
jgi:hypothetical protein